jgi:hypothetical protein
MSETPFVLLVNPWICDFAAHDLWAKPLGLLQIGALLRKAGYRVGLIDCLDRHDEDTNRRDDVLPPTFHPFGTGKFPKVPLETPGPITDVPRRYYRYGIHPDSLRKQLQEIPRPDLILTTCMMTYWYPGLQQTIEVIREIHPGVSVWLGGVYARLCTRHAREHSGADRVITDSLPALEMDAWPPPALDLTPYLEYAPLLTGLGCPYDCPYCASARLQPVRARRRAEKILAEIEHWHTGQGVVDFAFYDDALLIDAEEALVPVLRRVAEKNLKVRFHTPNGLHIRPLTLEVCRLLFDSGFETLRLGLETTCADHQKNWGGKVDTDAYLKAVQNLGAAGFSQERIGVYLLGGLPGQTPGEVAEAVRVVQESGARPHLCEYSPVPGTPTYREALKVSRFDLENEPLTHNNSFFACRRPGFTYQDLMSLKETTRMARRGRSVV